MKLPKVLRVGNHTYDVIAKRKVYFKGELVCGTLDADKRIIEIGEQETKSDLLETLVHEMLHAIGWEAGIKQLQTDRNNLVDRIARALVDVITTNNLSKYLRG